MEPRYIVNGIAYEFNTKYEDMEGSSRVLQADDGIFVPDHPKAVEKERKAQNKADELSPGVQKLSNENLQFSVKDGDLELEQEVRSAPQEDDYKQEIIQCTTKDNSKLQLETDDLDLKLEADKEKVANVKQPIATETHRSDATILEPEVVNCDVSQMIPEDVKCLSLEDFAVVCEKQQTDEKIMDDLKREVEQLKAENSILQAKIDKTGIKLGEANMKKEGLNKHLKDKRIAKAYILNVLNADSSKAQDELARGQDYRKVVDFLEKELLQMKQAQIRLQNQNSYILGRIEAKREEFSILKSEIEDFEEEETAETEALDTAQKELEILYKRNNELIVICKADAAAKREEEERMQEIKQKIIEELRVSRELNSSLSERQRFLEGEPMRTKEVVEAMMASLGNGLHWLGLVIEEGCKHIKTQLSALTEKIPVVKTMLSALHREKKELMEENHDLMFELLSIETIVLILKEKVWMQGEKVVGGLKEKLKGKEEEVLARNEGKREAIRQLCASIGYHCERYNQLLKTHSALT